MTSLTNKEPSDGKKAAEGIDEGRRGLFALAAALPLLAIGLGSRARAADPAPAPCFNPANVSAGQKNLSEGVKFKLSTDPQKQCGGCTYFTGSTVTEGCGKCRLLLNRPVSAGNVCNSWTKKA